MEKEPTSTSPGSANPRSLAALMSRDLAAWKLAQEAIAKAKGAPWAPRCAPRGR